MYFPEPPDVPDDQRATGRVHVRYEDICQDGRVTCDALAHSLGAVVWQHGVAKHPLSLSARTTGVLPLLTRLVIAGGGGPVSVARPLDGSGRFALSHCAGDDGQVARLLLEMWVDVAGVRARTNGPPPPGAGQPVVVGRVYGEHVFTRPFGPPAERKVLALDVPGLPPVPPLRRLWRAPEATLALPEGAVPLDDQPVLDPAPIAFGLAHTDSNQHVNSLVYPRLFEEAALRRLASQGAGKLLASHVEVAYRKPSFAGDRIRISLRAFTLGDALGAVGFFHGEGDGDAARPRCFAQMRFG